MQKCIDTVFFGQVCDSCDGGSIFKILALLIKILTAGIGVLAVLGITIAGIMYLTSSGDEARMAKAKKRIFQVVIGLLVYGVMFAVLQFLIPGGILQSDLTTNTSSCPAEDTSSSPTSGTPVVGSGGQADSGSSQGSTGTETTSTPQGKTTSLSLMGQNWTVADTANPVKSYQHYIVSNKIAQDGKDCKDKNSCSDLDSEWNKCLQFAATFAHDLYYGTKIGNDELARGARVSHTMLGPSNSITSSSKQEILKAIYEQIIAGKPVIAKMAYHTQNSRHFVTIVGFKSSVTSADQLKESDLLILNTDGALVYNVNDTTRKGDKDGRSTGGKALRMFAQNGLYQIYHP